MKKKVESSALKSMTKSMKKSITNTFINNKLVIEKSKQNNLIENNEIIWNCSKGEINIFYWGKRNRTFK